MEIKFAEVCNAPLIHDIMIKAFMEYKDEVPPSSALKETVESISSALKENEKGFIYYLDEKPAGLVRFQLTENGLYFYRLSVIPEKQGQGIAKRLIQTLENYAKEKQVSALICKVRLTLPKNIKLYNSAGFKVINEEVVHKPNGINIKVVSMKKQLNHY
ncbi:GNAT family N-acetyltransferase [Mesobacillus foraminis]|uniref:GNAT family N-acetyltransferase n=1 Tax=Mesobacillus foraminis TaxID=279826 RepID=UPI000EF4AA62|nr:GNAT family N-acetyltransferase [Mesobacillus foraminis]